MIKIAIPCYEKKLCMHFGHCESFAFVTADENEKKVIKCEFVTPPDHAPGIFPAWVSEKGAQLVIAGGMGMNAQRLFANYGIQVICGAPAEKPEEIVLKYLVNKLVTGENTCDH